MDNNKTAKTQEKQTNTWKELSFRKKGFSFSSMISGLSEKSLEISLETFYKLYRRNGDIRTAIRKTAKKIGARGVYLESNTSQTVVNKAETLNSILDLFSMPTFTDFKIEALKHLLVSGELYLIPNFNGRNEIIKFQILDPKTMSKLVNKDGEVEGFRQYAGWNIKYKDYKLEEISYFQLEKDPDNEINGMSILEGIVWDALTDLNATQSNYYFFENDSVPRAVFLLNEDMDYEDEAVMSQIISLQNQMKGSKNKHKSIASNLVKDVKPIALNNKDIEFISQRKLTTEKVCAVLEVPKSLLGYVDNVNYANAENMYKTWIESTVKPYEEYFEFVINSLLKKFIVNLPNVTLRLETEDLTDIYKTHEDQRADVQAGILSVDEVRIDRGLEPKADEQNSETPEDN